MATHISPRNHEGMAPFDDEVLVDVEDATPPSINDIESPKFPTLLKTLCFSTPFVGFLFANIQARSVMEINKAAHLCNDATAQTFLHIYEVLDKHIKCSLASNLFSVALLVIAAITGFPWPLGCSAIAAVYAYRAYRDLSQIKNIQLWIEHYQLNAAPEIMNRPARS